MNDQSRVLLEGMDDSMDYYYSTYTTTSITTQWELQSLYPSKRHNALHLRDCVECYDAVGESLVEVWAMRYL